MGIDELAREPYRMVVEHERADAAILVAAHDWDVAVAAAAGLATVFVAREGRRPFGAVTAPTFVIADLSGLADVAREPARSRSSAASVSARDPR